MEGGHPVRARHHPGQALSGDRVQGHRLQHAPQGRPVPDPDEDLLPGRGRGHLARSETVKGYEYAPGEYVVVTDEDLENVPLKTVRSIEIEQFTKAERDDATVRFVKSAYYLEPDKVGRKAFYLLKSVLEDEGLTAICKVVIKDREALAAIDPFGDTMLMTTLHWPDEIRSTAELDLRRRGLRLQAGRARDGPPARRRR